MTIPTPRPSLTVVPEFIASAQRKGITVGMQRRPNYCAWAVLGFDGQLIVGPRNNQSANLGNKGLAAAIEEAIAEVGGGTEVYSLDYKLEDVMAAGTGGITTVHTSPPPGARKIISEALDRRCRQMCSSVTLFTDASKGSGLTVGTGWSITYQNGPDPIFGNTTHRAAIGSNGAELLAIRDGLHDIAFMHRDLMNAGSLKVVIKSDSQDALRVVDCILGDTEPPRAINYHVIRDAYDQIALYSKKMKLRTEWVRGHNGDAGNEAADRLAVNARRVVELETPHHVARTLFSGIVVDARSSVKAA